MLRELLKYAADADVFGARRADCAAADYFYAIF